MSIGALAPLTTEAAKLGLVEFACAAHGPLVVTALQARVTCRCGKTAKPVDGYRCPDCGEAFGSRTLLDRHRVGGSRNKRCLSYDEKIGKDWFQDDEGRWRKRGSFSEASDLTIREGIEAVLGVSKSVHEASEALGTAGDPAPMLGASPEGNQPRKPVHETPKIELPNFNPTRNWKRGAPGSAGGVYSGRLKGGSREGYVYFFQGDTTRRVKIGFSEDPERRLGEIRKGASERMRLLGSVVGTTGDEATHHRANSSSWVLDEWFAEDVFPQVADVLGVDVKTLEAIPFN
jgi:hypothetical protein